MISVWTISRLYTYFRQIWLEKHSEVGLEAETSVMASMGDKDELFRTYEPHPDIKSNALVQTMEQYREMHKQSIEDPESFWRPIADSFFFKSPPQGKFLDYNFDVRKGPIFIKWMEGAVTNICFNALDRHVQKGLGEKIAFFWWVAWQRKHAS